METEFFRQFPSFLGLGKTKEAKSDKSYRTKSPVDYRIDFVMKYYPIAVEAGKKYGIHPLLLLSQAAVESRWLSNELSRKYNNFFCLSADGVDINEHWNGRYGNTSDGRRMKIYKSARDSFFDFAYLMKTHYPKAAQVSKSIVLYADSIANNPLLKCPKKDQMARLKYRVLLIRTAISIKTVAEVFYWSKNN